MIYSLSSSVFFFLLFTLCFAATTTAATVPGPYYGPVSMSGVCGGVRRAVVNPNTGDVYGTCFSPSNVLMWSGGQFANQPIILANSSLCFNPQAAVLSQQGDLYVECWNGGGSNDFVLKFPQAQPASVVTPVKIGLCGGGLAVSSNNTLYATCNGVLSSVTNGGSGVSKQLSGSCGTNSLAISPVNGDVAAACSGGSVTIWPGGLSSSVVLKGASSGSNLAVAYDNFGNLFTTVQLSSASTVSMFAYNPVSNTYSAAIALSAGSAQAVALWFANGVGLYSANTDGSISFWPVNNLGTIDGSIASTSISGSGACSGAQGFQVMPITNKVYCAALNTNAVVAFLPFSKCW